MLAGELGRAVGVHASKRLFFALWPDVAIQRQLADLALELALETKGRPIPWHNIHGTVAFLGDVADEKLAELVALGRERMDFSCTLVLDQVASFQRGIVYATSSQTPHELLEFAAELRQTLRAHGYPIERRRFVPHLTLLRNARRPLSSRAITPIAWRVRGVRLVQSELQPAGAVYHLAG